MVRKREALFKGKRCFATEDFLVSAEIGRKERDWSREKQR